MVTINEFEINVEKTSEFIYIVNSMYLEKFPKLCLSDKRDIIPYSVMLVSSDSDDIE